MPAILSADRLNASSIRLYPLVSMLIPGPAPSRIAAGYSGGKTSPAEHNTLLMLGVSVGNVWMDG